MTKRTAAELGRANTTLTNKTKRRNSLPMKTLKKQVAHFLLLLSYSLFSLSALQASELMVYTSRNQHLIEDIFKAYTEETGVKIHFRTGDPGQLTQTLIAQRNNPRADLYMTVDAGNLWYAAEEGLLAKLDSEVLQQNVPPHLRDQNNQWFGLSKRARTIIYNPTKVNPVSDLSTYEQLATESWKNRLCLRTSRKVYNQSLVAMFIHQHGYEKAKEIVQGWLNNTVEIFANDTAVIRAVAAGQCDVGIVNTYYVGRVLRDDPSASVAIFWPNQEEGNYGVHVNVSGAGVVKNAPHKKEAIRFLEWLSSQRAQEKFAQVNFEYSVNENVAQDPLVKSWGQFRDNQNFNLSLAGSLQAQAIRLMHEVNYN